MSPESISDFNADVDSDQRPDFKVILTILLNNLNKKPLCVMYINNEHNEHIF